MIRLVLVLLTTLMLAACSSAPIRWQRAGASDMDLKQDAYACERDQPVIYCQYLDCFAVEKRLAAMYRRCMESKGWEKGDN